MNKTSNYVLAVVLNSLLLITPSGRADEVQSVRPEGQAAAIGSSDVIAKLRDVAYGKNSAGEFKEPSSRVRDAAKKALSLHEAPAKPTGQASGIPSAHAEEATSATAGQGPVRAIASVGGPFQFADFQPPPAPIQPAMPPTNIQPVLPPPTSGGATDESLGGLAFAPSLEQSFREMAAAPSGTPVQGMTAAQANAGGQNDTAAALSQADSVQNLDVQLRSAVSFDPHIRGYKWGQIYTQADGVYWTPARLDLDTMLNKIDPGMINDITIVPGPYGLRYGPGFAFIDVNRAPTPRHCNGFEAEFDTTGNVRTNGGQVYARETASGGGADWGFRMSYGERKGSDYEAGNGHKIPSSYFNRDLWGELSFDVNPHQRVEIAYQRLDQTNTEYPGQFFDLDAMSTYGFQGRIIDDDPTAPWTKMTMEGWHNRTWFHGDTSRKFNPDFPIMQRVDYALDVANGINPNNPAVAHERLAGLTSGGAYSTGARAGATFGDKDNTQFNTGVDLRYLGQVIGEEFGITGPVPDYFTTNMPHSWTIDPGVFAEISNPLTDRWTASVGARLDFARSTARASDLRGFSDAPPFYQGSLPGIADDFSNTSVLQQNDTLVAFYLTNKFKLDEHWTLTGGFGQGQRAPTLIERYADGLFISMLQSGLTRVVGDPSLKPERDWQIDLGLSAEYENWRGRISAYQAWIQDYVTYEDGSVAIPVEFADARLLNFTNTGLATLVGAELAAEYDWSAHLTPFGKVAYVDGRDRDIDAPLPAMSPLDGTVGLRIHDCQKGRQWGMEVAARMVVAQGRLGTIRTAGSTDLTVVEERTPGFAVCNLRGYYNIKKNLHFLAGIDNVFDRNYQEHLDVRVSGPTGFVPSVTRVLEPGFSPYIGLNWVF